MYDLLKLTRNHQNWLRRKEKSNARFYRSTQNRLILTRISFQDSIGANQLQSIESEDLIRQPPRLANLAILLLSPPTDFRIIDDRYHRIHLRYKEEAKLEVILLNLTLSLQIYHQFMKIQAIQNTTCNYTQMRSIERKSLKRWRVESVWVASLQFLKVRS